MSSKTLELLINMREAGHGNFGSEPANDAEASPIDRWDYSDSSFLIAFKSFGFILREVSTQR